MHHDSRVLLTIRLLDDHIYRLRLNIETQDNLSKPVAEGRWRWADVHIDGYTPKTSDELAIDRARALSRAAAYRYELALALEARADYLESANV